MAIQNENLTRLVNYIEENIRISDQTTIQYIDPRGQISRLNNKQNQVIFGRRGSGKSLLLKSLANQHNRYGIYIKVNLEDFKDVSFPNSLLQVLIQFFNKLKDEINNEYKWYQLKRKRRAKKLIEAIDSQIERARQRIIDPDIYEESIRQRGESRTSGGVKATVLDTAEISVEKEKLNESEVQKSVKVDKLNKIKNEITDLKALINEIGTFFDGRHIFLVFDDFYFTRKIDQPFFIDFFHRLTKDTVLYLKIATIKHRTSLYTQGSDTYVGVELGHDAQSIELDYTLDQLLMLQTFMWDLLKQANRNANAGVDLESLITENAFKQLCIASGGVPRDFLSLFIKLCGKIINGVRISKREVNETAIENYPNKLENFKRDSAEERELLEQYLQYLKDFMLKEKKTNMFLVSNDDLANYPQIRQAIKELVDLRLLHLVDHNSGRQGDGNRYSAYMIDVGLYPNSLPRINEIEPGLADDKGRKDNIRSAPKVNLEDFKNYISGLAIESELQLTE